MACMAVCNNLRRWTLKSYRRAGESPVVSIRMHRQRQQLLVGPLKWLQDACHIALVLQSLGAYS